MVKSIIKSALVALGAIALFASCDLLKPKEDEPILSLNPSAAQFSNGKASLELALSAKSSSDVTVSLADEGNIPSDALSYDKSVKVEAGVTSVNVPVTVDASNLAAGSYETTIKLVSVTGAKEDPSKNSCKVSLVVEEQQQPEPEPVIPIVSISAYDDEFKDNTATITLALDVAGDKDITVKFAVSAYENYAPIPAEALTFDNPVTIPAGSTSQVVTITLDPSQLAVGENWAVVSIESVSENAKLDESKKSAYLLATGEATIQEVPEWTLSYAGRAKSTDGTLLDWIKVDGWEGDFFDIQVYEAGTLAEVYGGDIKALMQARHSEWVGKYIQYGIINLLYSQAGYCAFDLLDPGSYEVYLFDYDKTSAEMTGKYAGAQFEVAEEEASEAFNALLGVYTVTVGEQTRPENYIYPNVNNYSYVVYLSDWDEEDQQYYHYPFVLDWDSETGALSATTQIVDEWTNANYGKVEYWQYGSILEDNQYYYVTGNYPILSSEGMTDGSFTCHPGPDLTLSGGSTYSIAGLYLVGALPEYDKGQYAFTYLHQPLPAIFTRNGDLPAEEEEASVSSAKGIAMTFNKGNAPRAAVRKQTFGLFTTFTRPVRLDR